MVDVLVLVHVHVFHTWLVAEAAPRQIYYQLTEQATIVAKLAF